MKTAAVIQLDLLAELDAIRATEICAGCDAGDVDLGRGSGAMRIAAITSATDIGAVVDHGVARQAADVRRAADMAAADYLADTETAEPSGAHAVAPGATPPGARTVGDPRRGVPGEVSALVAASYFGCSRDAMAAFVRHDHFEGEFRRVGSRDHCYVVVDDWSVSLRDRYVALLASKPPLADVAAFRRLDDIKVKSDCADVPVGDHWIERYFALPDRYVGHDYPQEIRSVLTAPDEEVSRISRILQLMDDDGRVYADRVAIPEGDLRRMLIDGLSPDVPPFEFTWLHPTKGAKAPPIDEVACARILRMPTGRRRDRASFHVASAAANGELIQLNVAALSHFRTLTILDGVDDDDEDGIEARWTSFLKGELLPTVGRSAIVRTYHDELACERTMLKAAEEPVSRELKEWLRANAPLIPDGDGFHDLVRDTVQGSVAAGDAKRKSRSDVISDAFDDHAAEAEAALKEATALHEAVQKGHRSARDAEAYGFSFPMPILGQGRRDTGATMIVDMISMRCDALLEELLKQAKARGEELTPKSFLRRHAPGGDRHSPDLARRRFAVYVGVEALDPDGAAATDPSMMAGFRVGATLAPGMLPDATVAARRAQLAATGLPIPSLRPKGLVGGRDPFELNLMIWGLRSGILIYPAESFVQGCSNGNLFYRIRGGAARRSSWSTTARASTSWWTRRAGSARPTGAFLRWARASRSCSPWTTTLPRRSRSTFALRSTSRGSPAGRRRTANASRSSCRPRTIPPRARRPAPDSKPRAGR